MSAEMGKPNLEAFSDTLQELAANDPDIIVVTSDSRGSGKLVPFAERFPDQIVEVGIAEQNLVGVAAGLASCGKKVFAVSPACFLTTRSFEQAKNDVCYSNQPVTLVGISAGVSYGPLGSTHHSLHDFAAFRAVHNIEIIAPADNFETREAVKYAAECPFPVYLRFGKRPLPHLHAGSTGFIPGKATEIVKGKDVAMIASGETVEFAVAAANLLSDQGIEASVTSMHTIKALDTDMLLSKARACRAILTIEEHSINGGLGEACAAVLMQAGISGPFRILGLPDEDTVPGSQLEILRHYGISADGIAEHCRQLLK